jgi:hypothetical protein
MDCEDFRDGMLDVLYDEADAKTVESVAAHTAACAACRDELAGLREVRHSLETWTLPRLPHTVRRFAPPRYFWAAAAAALLAVGLSGAARLAGFQLRGDPAPAVVEQASSIPATLPAQAAPAEMVSLQPQNVSVASAPGVDQEMLLRRVEQMIRQSEQRQRAAYETSLASFEQRTNLQRRYDLARINAGMSYLDTRTGQHTARTTELMGQILQASNRREP